MPAERDLYSGVLAAEKCHRVTLDAVEDLTALDHVADARQRGQDAGGLVDDGAVGLGRVGEGPGCRDLQGEPAALDRRRRRGVAARLVARPAGRRKDGDREDGRTVAAIAAPATIRLFCVTDPALPPPRDPRTSAPRR